MMALSGGNRSNDCGGFAGMRVLLEDCLLRKVLICMMRASVTVVVCCSLPLFAQSKSVQDKLVHLNQIQVVGTHNSYNMGFAPSEAKYFEEHYAKSFHG